MTYEGPEVYLGDIIKIHAVGLEEEIRCAICMNRMHTSRGCDGACDVDNSLLNRVCDVIYRRMVKE